MLNTLKTRLMIRDGVRVQDALKELDEPIEEMPDQPTRERENTNERQVSRPRRAGRRYFVEE